MPETRTHQSWLTAAACLALIAQSSGQDAKPDRLFTAWDKNRDGRLTRSELPEQNRRNFSAWTPTRTASFL